MDDSFVKAPVSVPKLSGFDKSHQNLFTSKVGTITPVLVDELIPGSKVHLRMALSASLPPLASDTFMRCSIKSEAFFVPMRLLCQSFESFFTDQPRTYFENGNAVQYKGMLPRIKVSAPSGADISPLMGVGSLSDYLGFRSGNASLAVERGLSAMPYLAYHRIYNDWYRNTLVQRECFLPRSLNGSTSASPGSGVIGSSAASAPFDFYDETRRNYGANSLTLADGHNLMTLRQRNFGLDYFTTATPEPQQGSAQVVSFATDGATGQFSIAALRAANSMQQFKERNNLLGNLYVEQLYGRYGVRPSDGIAQRSLYLGRGEFEVYSKGIYQTNNVDFANAASNPNTIENGSNPFGSIGSRYGSAYASGQNFLVNFEAKEPGYLFVMATLVPRVTYSSGIDPMLFRYTENGSISEMANPILQNVGPEPIYLSQLTGDVPAEDEEEQVFGFTDRYGQFKTKQDVLHGLLRDGQSLESFALQRTFQQSADVQLSSDFLQIPTTYLDQVTAVKGWLSQYGYWCDTYFDYKVAMPLSKYSLPSLQDPAYEHGKTIVVSKGGQKL